MSSTQLELICSAELDPVYEMTEICVWRKANMNNNSVVLLDSKHYI